MYNHMYKYIHCNTNYQTLANTMYNHMYKYIHCTLADLINMTDQVYITCISHAQYSAAA